MSTPADHTTRASHSSSVPAVEETRYLCRPEGRIGLAEADWIARALRAKVVMVPEAGHYSQSQRPDITTGAVLRFLESVTGRA
jgi:hypothetical protein